MKESNQFDYKMLIFLIDFIANAFIAF